MTLARMVIALPASRSQYTTIGGPPTCATPLKKPERPPTKVVTTVVVLAG